MDTRIDLLILLIVIALGIAVLGVTTTIAEGVYRDAVGPRPFPYFVGIVLVGAGAILLVHRLRDMAADTGWKVEEEGTADEPGHPASLARALAVMALCVAYAACFVPLGYLIATPLFVAGAMVALDERSPGKIAALSLGWTVITYAIFAMLLSVRMPVGPLRSLFRDLGLINL